MKAFKARAKATGITPRPLLERVQLLKKDLPYWEAFHILNSGRQSGMGPNPLMISEIMALVVTGGIAFIPDRPKYLRLMQKLDATFMEYLAEKAPKPKA